MAKKVLLKFHYAGEASGEILVDGEITFEFGDKQIGRLFVLITEVVEDLSPDDRRSLISEIDRSRLPEEPDPEELAETLSEISSISAFNQDVQVGQTMLKLAGIHINYH